MTMNGIDISQWQKGLKLANIMSDFVIIKATEGVGFTDPQFHNFMEQALALNKRIGVYHFARPYAQSFNDPITEANWFYRVIQPYVGRAMLILDWEAERKHDVQWAKKWLDQVYKLSGVKPVFYSYESCVNQYDWSSVAKDYDLWVARYLDYVPDYNYDMSKAGPLPKVKWWKRYMMWQWTSSGRLTGWSGNLDCDLFYGDSQVWQAYIAAHVVIPDTPVPPDEPKDPLDEYTDEELAERVMQGIYGNGPDRRKALGARYEPVQKIVDQICANRDKPYQTYVVQRGDTLSAIAKKYGTTYQRIAMDNHLANPNLIFPGQKLIIKKVL